MSWFLAAFLFGTSSALAEVPEWIRGKILFDHYESVGPARDARSDGILQSGFILHGTASPDLGEGFRGKATFLGTALRKTSVKGEAQELWLAYSLGGFDFKLGQIITPWGRSDAVNPTDFLTAKDLTFLSTSDEIRRRGAPGARVVFVPSEGASPLEITAAWSARHPQTRMLIPAGGVPSGLTLETDPENPPYFGDAQEWALKVAYLAPAFDFSISGFSGRNHFGQMVWDGSKITTRFEREKALGADFSVTFDDFVFRGETAYFFYESGERGGAGYSLTEPNHSDTVLGIERAFGPRVRAIAQALYRVHPGLQDPSAYVGSNPTETAIGRGLGAANALIQNYQEKSELGATLLGTYTSPEGEWVFEFGVLGNFIGGDFVIRPKATHKIRDSLRATLGSDFYGGPPEKTLGALRNFRSAYLEASLDF